MPNVKTETRKELFLRRFRSFAEGHVAIPDDEWEDISAYFDLVCHDRNSFLAEAGEKLEKVYSITRGLVRYYYTTELGREFNKYFVMDNRPFGSYRSLFLGQPCGYFIQALEDTEVLVIRKAPLEKLYRRHACWERLGRLCAMSFITHMEQREKEFLLDPLEVRYRRFLEEYPDLIDRIPQYHIASYLGVTDVALSRLRKRINLVKLHPCSQKSEKISAINPG